MAQRLETRLLHSTSNKLRLEDGRGLCEMELVVQIYAYQEMFSSKLFMPCKWPEMLQTLSSEWLWHGNTEKQGFRGIKVTYLNIL